LQDCLAVAGKVEPERLFFKAANTTDNPPPPSRAKNT